MPSKKIIYIGTFGYPDTAAGMRVFNMGKLMRRQGYDVSFICVQKNRNFPRVQTIDEFQYIAFQLKGGLGKCLNILDLYTGIFTIQQVKRELEKLSPDVVILYNDAGHLTKALLKFCKQRKIILGADVTEWYEINRCSGFNRFVAKKVNDRICHLDQRLDFIIAISPFLMAYYLKQGCKVYEIPPLVDKVEAHSLPRFRYADGSRLNIAYAGSPGQKDNLGALIKSIYELNKNKVQIHLDLIGVNKEYVITQMQDPNFDYDNSGIIAYGRLSHERTLQILRHADFTTLFRENLRYAKAGFSTKFAESLSLGIPVICNEVGGADQLLSGTHAGIVLPDGDERTITNTLKKLLSESDDFFIKAFSDALELATKYFLIDSYL